MRTTILCALVICACAVPAIASEGMIDVASDHNVKETSDRLEGILSSEGMTVFVRINHAEGARKAGVELRDTELIVFGNPKVGGPLMKCRQTAAIDLPQKALIWEDEKADVWISYNDPGYVARRHAVPGCEAVLSKIEKALAGMVQAAAE